MSNEIGKQTAPFTMFSSSADGGYLTDLHSNFTGSVEINNLHSDEYGELVGAPLQGPFTYQWVGGHQHRHQEALSTTDRGEAFHIKPGSSTIKIYGADYPNAHAAKALLTRGGVAKRALNIANLRTTTGSLSQGNYDHNMQVIQTSGKTQNPRHFAENSENYQQFAERKTQEGNVFNSIMVNMQVTNPAQDHANWITNNVISVTKTMTDQSGASLGSRTVAEFEGGTSVTLPTNLTSPSAFTETIPSRRMDSPYRYTGTITINADIGIGGTTPEESQGDILFFLVSKDDIKWHAVYIVGEDDSTHGTYGAHIDLNVPYVTNRLVTGTSITINPTTFGWSANQLYRVRIGQFFFASDLNDRYAIDNISITGNSFELEKRIVGSLRNFTLPTGSANKSIITNRFSAPGDRYTMSRGFLNPSGEEMSVYNSLPYRNENVRLNLRDSLSKHMSSQGYELINPFSGISDFTTWSGFNSTGFENATLTLTDGDTSTSLGSVTVGAFQNGDTASKQLVPDTLKDKLTPTTTLPHRRVIMSDSFVGKSKITIDIGIGANDPEDSSEEMLFFLVSKDGTNWHRAYVVGEDSKTADDGWETYIDLTIPDDLNHIYKDKVINIDPADFGWSDSEFYQVMLGQYNRSDTDEDIWLINNPRVDITPPASLHKVNRNTLRQLEGGVEGTTVTTGSQYDNFFVQHPIPRSDLSYAWVTASISSTAMDSLYGYQKNSSDISFDLPQKDFTERTLFDYNPTTNTTLLPLAATGPMSGAYGFSSWEAMRRTDYKSTRYIRDNNLFSFWTSENKTYANTTVVTQSAVTSKYKPIQHTATITGDENNTPFTFKSTYSNDLNYFGEQKSTDVEAKLGLYKDDDETFYATVKGYYIQPESDNTNNPFGTVNKVRVSETVYPKDKSAYTVGTRARSNYTEVAGTGENGYDRQYGKQNTFYHSTKTRSEDTKNSFGFTLGTSTSSETKNFIFNSNLTLPPELISKNNDGLIYDSQEGKTSFVFGIKYIDKDDKPRFLQPTFDISGSLSISFSFVKGAYTPLELSVPDLDQGTTELEIQYQEQGTTSWTTARVKDDVGNYSTSAKVPDHEEPTGTGQYSTFRDMLVADYSRTLSSELVPLVRTDGTIFTAGTKIRIVQRLPGHYLGHEVHYAITDLNLVYNEFSAPSKHLKFFPLATDGEKSFPLSASFRGHVGELMTDEDSSAYTSSPRASQCLSENVSLVKGTILSDFLERTTSTLAGVNPWEDSYDNFREDFRGLAKDMSVLPEFKISDHLDEYYTDFNFAKPPTDYLTLQGGDIAKGEVINTGTENFFDRFTTSEPLRDYKQFLEDHAEEGLEIKSMKIKVDTVKKLLPYNGFYPMTRTLQLGNLLSASFIENVTGKEGEISGFDNQGFQTISKTLMSPGLLYNSIKAGYGVSYPIYKTSPVTDIDNESADKNVYEDFHIETAPDYQIPFDALLNPKGNLPENEDVVFTPSWSATTPFAPSYIYTGQWNGTAKPQFQLGMHNFLAETVKFFLKDEQLVSHVSEPQKEGFDVEAGKTYYMDVVLRDNVKMDRMGTYSGTVSSSADSYLNVGSNQWDVCSGSDGFYKVVRKSDPFYPLQVYTSTAGAVNPDDYRTNYETKICMYHRTMDASPWKLLDEITLTDTPSLVESVSVPLSMVSSSSGIYVGTKQTPGNPLTLYNSDNDIRTQIKVYKFINGKFSTDSDTITPDMFTTSPQLPAQSDISATEIKMAPTSQGGYYLLTNHYSNAGFSHNNGSETITIGAGERSLLLYESSSQGGIVASQMFKNATPNYRTAGSGRHKGFGNHGTFDVVSASYTDDPTGFRSSSLGGVLISAGYSHDTGSIYPGSSPTYIGSVNLYYSSSLYGTASTNIPNPAGTTGRGDYFGSVTKITNNSTGPNRKFYFAANSFRNSSHSGNHSGSVTLFTGSLCYNSASKNVEFKSVGKTFTFGSQYLSDSGFGTTSAQNNEFGSGGSLNTLGTTTTGDKIAYGLAANLSITTTEQPDGVGNKVYLAIANTAAEYQQNGTHAPTHYGYGSLMMLTISGSGYTQGAGNTQKGNLTFLPSWRTNWSQGNLPLGYINSRFNDNIAELVGSGNTLKILSCSSHPYNPGDDIAVFTSCRTVTAPPTSTSTTRSSDTYSGHSTYEDWFAYTSKTSSRFDNTNIVMLTGSGYTGSTYAGTYASANTVSTNLKFSNKVNISSDFTYRKDGALYGQPVENAYDPAYSAYTPPSFYGTSVARISYTAPEYGGKVSLPEIFRDATVQEIFELDTNRTAKFYSKTSEMTALQKSAKMPLSSSVTLFGARIPRVDNAFDTRDVQWVIGSKFESPVLDFAPNDTAHSSSYTARNQALMNSLNFVSNASHLPPRSMWTSYGSIPSDEKGITLEVKESYDQGILNSPTTGSLVELCGFKAQSKKMGQVSTSKEISEAIVLIPYVKGGFGPSGIGNGSKAMKRAFKFANSSAEVNTRSANIKQFTNSHSFIPIKASTFNSQFKKLQEGEDSETTITKMIQGMEKYILPPHMDFLKAYKKNDNKWTGSPLLPFAMYFIEVDHDLDQEDLLNIWQGVMPKIARDFDGEELSQVLEHDIDDDNLFHKPDLLKRAIKQDLSFMVFKVKQRAEANYFNVTKDSIDDIRYQFDFDGDGIREAVPEYSYNWPYDFFSLIETAKVTIDLNLEEIPEPEITTTIVPPLVIRPARPMRTRERIRSGRTQRTRIKQKVQRRLNKPRASARDKINTGNRPKPRPRIRGVR